MIVLFICLFVLEERKFESVNAFEHLVYIAFYHTQVSFRYTARKSSFLSVELEYWIVAPLLQYIIGHSL